ncbi:MAG: TIR domain-containing protein [Gammaproteobacteria bacterium]
MSARIFISHAAENGETALRMLDWLKANGWHDVFLDLDPEEGIRAGEAWQKALLAAADRCEAIICLLTSEWVASKWCWAEYVLAKRMGKRCVPVIVAALDWNSVPLEIRAEHQIVDLTSDAAGWTRLRIGLQAAGVDAADFALPPGRGPYPGLRALTEDEAALFFGRKSEVLAALDVLRGMAETPTLRLFVILGPSGAGKSSLLRAGLWPRLARDDRNFLPLPTIRPSGAVLTGQIGFWAAIEGACRERRIASHLPGRLPRSRGEIRAAAGADPTVCRDFMDELARAGAAAALLEGDARPTVVIPIDQGEELFTEDGWAESERFLAVLGDLLAAPGGPIAAIAIRTDAYPRLQAEGRIAGGIHRPFNLAPMPPDRFRAVIEEPAARAAVQIEPALTDALVRDASGADALPLLAFTIERLHRDFAVTGRLKLADYAAMGGVQGAIEASVEAVFRATSEKGLPRDREALEQLTRRIFLPHLVRVNEAGEFTRRTVSIGEIPAETRRLLDLFVEHRLLVADRDEGRGTDTVEVAHEALLRAWPRMAEWLKQERGFLVWREEIARNRARWEAGDRDLLGGRELAIAQGWRSERAADIAAQDLAFIGEGERHAAAQAARERRRQAWVVRGALAVALVVAVLGGISFWQRFEAVSARDKATAAQQEAQQQARLARARELAILAENVLDQRAGETARAGLLAVESLRSAHTIEGYRAWRRVMELTPPDISAVETPWHWSNITLSPDGRLVAFSRTRGDASDGPAAGAVALVDGGSGVVRSTFRHDGWVAPVFSPDGHWLAVFGYGRKLQVVDAASGKVALEAGYDDMVSAQFDPTSRSLFIARTDGIVEVREGAAWNIARRLAYPASSPRPQQVALAVSRYGDRIAVADRNPKAYVIPTNGGPATELSGHEKGVVDVLFDATGRRVVTRAWDQTVRVWDAHSGTLLHTLAHPRERDFSEITALAVDDEGSAVASAMEAGGPLVKDAKLFVWDAKSGEQRWALSYKAYVNDIAIAPGGRLMATASDDRTAAVWDMQTGEQRLRLQHDDEVWSLVMAADGRTLVTGSKDGWARFFDLASGTELRRVHLDGGVTSLAFDPSSNALAVGVALSKHEQAWTDVAIVDFKTRTPVSSFSHNGGFSHMAFNPDGGSLATTLFKTEEIKLWDVASGTLRSVPEAKARRVFFTPDGARLVTDPGGGEAFVLDTATGHPLAAFGEPGGVNDFGLAADGRTLTTYGADGWFRGWDALTGKELWRRKETGGGELSADGNRFASRSADGSAVEIAETRDGHVVASIPVTTPWTFLEFAADGHRLLFNQHQSGTEKELSMEVELWETDNGGTLLTRRQSSSLLGHFTGMGNRAVTIEDRLARSVEFIDTRDGKTIWVGETPGDSSGFRFYYAANLLILDKAILNLKTGKTVARDIGSLTAVAETSDGARLILAVDQHVEIRDAVTGGLLRRFETGETVSELMLSKDGRYLFGDMLNAMRIKVWNFHDGSEVARIDMDGAARRIRPLADPDLVLVHDWSDRLRVWRASTRREERRFAHTAIVSDIAVAGGADRAVTWQGASIRLWDTRTGAEIARHITNGNVDDLSISPDGRWVGYRTDQPRQTDTGEPYEAVVLWEPDSGRDPQIVPSATEADQLVFSPDSKRIAARLGPGSDKDTVAIWDIGSLRSIATFRALPGSTVSEFAFSPDGARVLVEERGASRRSGLRVWDLTKTHELARVDIDDVLLQIPGSDTVMTRMKGVMAGWEGLWRTWSPGNTAVDPLTLWRAHFLKRISPGGLLLTSHVDGSDTLLDVDTGEQLPFSPPHEKSTVSVAGIARNARFVALILGDSQGVAHIYDVDTGSSVANLPHNTPISDLLFVDKDDSVVTTSVKTRGQEFWANRLHLWRWRSGETKTLSADNPIRPVAASPDGSVFATGEGVKESDFEFLPADFRSLKANISQARPWNARTGKELIRLPHSEPRLRRGLQPGWPSSGYAVDP